MCFHIYECTDVCVCVTVSVHIHACTFIHSQRSSLGIVFQECLPCPLKQGLSLALNLLVRLCWPKIPMKPLAFASLVMRLPRLFMGSETKILTSAWLAFYQLNFPFNSVIHYYNSWNMFLVINTTLFLCLTEIHVMRFKLCQIKQLHNSFQIYIKLPNYLK